MSLLARVLGSEKRGALIAGGSLQEPQSWLVDLLGGLPTGSGMRVTPDTAIGVVAIFAAVKLIATALASMPLVIYKKLPRDAIERDEAHPLFYLLHDQPNPIQTSQEFREMMAGHQILRGNAYAYKQYGKKGLEALIPLDPRRCNPFKMVQPPLYLDGPLYYRYQPHTGPMLILLQEEVLHLRGFSSDGFTGLSPIQVHREAVGLAMAQEAQGANFIRNGLQPSGALVHPGQLKPEARENLRASMEELHSGAANAGRPIVLEEGLKWERMGMTAEDAQYVNMRQFSIQEVGRIFQVPVHLLGELSRSTNNNIEQQGIEFLNFCLLPWAGRWTARIRTDLFTDEDRKSHDVSFLTDSLTRGDFKSRFDGYMQGRQWGWLSANDIRAKEGMNPIPDESGDSYMVPLNMQPSERLLEPPEPPAEPNDSQDPPSEGPDPEPTPGTNAAPLLIEFRDTIAERKRLRRSFNRMFADAGKRVVRKEAKAIRGAMKTHLDKRGAHGFNAWLDDYYKTHADTVQEALAPAHLTYAEAVHAQVSTELNSRGADAPVLRTLSADDLGTVMQAHGAAQAARHVQDSRSKIRAVLTAQADNPVPALNDMLDGWESSRHQAIADREVVAAESHVARAMISAAGRMAVWRADGAECPACQRMNEKTAAGQTPFLRVGEHIFDGDGKSIFTAKRVVPHAPLHDGCDCSVGVG